MHITLGRNTEDRYKPVLTELAEKTRAVGRNKVPSISELMLRIAKAAENDMEDTAKRVNGIIHILKK